MSIQNKFVPVTLSTILWLSLLISCNSEYSNDPAYKDLSFEDRVKLKQYVVQGEKLYQTHCQTCHQLDGTGLGKLIPQLTRSVLIKSDPGKVGCIIKYGLSGPWSVDSITFDGVMPPNQNLTNLEIAEIITFIGNNWDNKIGLVTSVDLEKTILSCQ